MSSGPPSSMDRETQLLPPGAGKGLAGSPRVSPHGQPLALPSSHPKHQPRFGGSSPSACARARPISKLAGAVSCPVPPPPAPSDLLTLRSFSSVQEPRPDPELQVPGSPARAAEPPATGGRAGGSGPRPGWVGAHSPSSLEAAESLSQKKESNGKRSRPPEGRAGWLSTPGGPVPLPALPLPPSVPPASV